MRMPENLPLRKATPDDSEFAYQAKNDLHAWYSTLLKERLVITP